MLDKFSALSVDVLSKLRHVRVSDDTLVLSYPDQSVFYHLVAAIKLLPGLQLDQLTVLGGRGVRVKYDTLGGLIETATDGKPCGTYATAQQCLGSRPNIILTPT